LQSSSALNDCRSSNRSDACFLQIVSSISQLVEANPDRIASGWRPLFSALRNVTFSEGQTLVS